MLNWKAFDFFFAQSGVGIAIDKLFNYVEHCKIARLSRFACCPSR